MIFLSESTSIFETPFSSVSATDSGSTASSSAYKALNLFPANGLLVPSGLSSNFLPSKFGF